MGEKDLLLDFKVFIGGVLVTVDLHVGHVSLLGGRGHGSGLLHLSVKTGLRIKLTLDFG